MSLHDDAVELERAAIAGLPFESAGVEDTPENRAAWERISAEVALMREKGAVIAIDSDIPDYSDELIDALFPRGGWRRKPDEDAGAD
ncbi:MAG: hypothetical protein R2737_11875 [Candidatus Nanopelagicales bacterium]